MFGTAVEDGLLRSNPVTGVRVPPAPSEWLGHADPAFTLRTYIHLMDTGVGDADFLDAAVSADPAAVDARAD